MTIIAAIIIGSVILSFVAVIFFMLGELSGGYHKSEREGTK